MITSALKHPDWQQVETFLLLIGPVVLWRLTDRTIHCCLLHQYLCQLPQQLSIAITFLPHCEITVKYGQAYHRGQSHRSDLNRGHLSLFNSKGGRQGEREREGDWLMAFYNY